MVITELHKRRGRLFLLVLDGEPSVTVDVRTFEESPYKVGSSLSSEQLEELLELSQQRRAREKALYLLSLRDHSKAELKKKLLRDADGETAESTANHMEELGLINDSAFAERRARDLIRRKLYPRSRVAQELYALGIDREEVQNIVNDIECDDAQQALALINKKYYNKMKSEEGIRKTTAALARYGFDGNAIRRAINEWQSEEQENDIDDL